MCLYIVCWYYYICMFVLYMYIDCYVRTVYFKIEYCVFYTFILFSPFIFYLTIYNYCNPFYTYFMALYACFHFIDLCKTFMLKHQ